jgi:hypothetical protein
VFLNQATTATARRREGFPWYTKEHADIPISNKHTTVHLSDAEREKLHNKMVTKATKAIEHVYPKNTFKSFIPGTNYISKNTTALREKVDCWTRGRWVKREGATLSPLPHFQDPHYGTCDRKYKHKGGESEWRPALHYEWEPECLMTEHLDSLQWCQIINGKNMLVVGDLVHYQLHDLILDSLRDGPAICFGELNCKGKLIKSLIYLFINK